SWSRVSLEGASDTVHSPSEAILLTDNPDDEAPSATIITHEGSLHPADPLDPYASYRIVGQLERRPLFGDWTGVEPPQMSDPAERFYHFTNGTSGDNARNIIAELESAHLSNPF